MIHARLAVSMAKLFTVITFVVAAIFIIGVNRQLMRRACLLSVLSVTRHEQVTRSFHLGVYSTRLLAINKSTGLYYGGF